MTLIAEHDGLSGADLYKAALTDGTPVVVKRSRLGQDLFQRLLGNAHSIELALWQEGVFDRLPSAVSAPTIGGWVDGDGAWIVMRDLGQRILGPDHAYDDNEIGRLLRGLDALHRSGIRPTKRTPLDRAVGMFSPTRIAAVVPRSKLGKKVEHGWDLLRGIAPSKLADPIVTLANNPAPLISALQERPSGFCHGDVAGVNMAWDGNGVVLLDWGQALVGPAAFDLARFLPSGLRSSPLSNDDILARYRELTGDRFDADGLELSLLASFIWYGWQKALDAVEADEPERGQTEAAGLQWWFERLPHALALLS